MFIPHYLSLTWYSRHLFLYTTYWSISTGINTGILQHFFLIMLSFLWHNESFEADRFQGFCRLWPHPHVLTIDYLMWSLYPCSPSCRQPATSYCLVSSLNRFPLHISLSTSNSLLSCLYTSLLCSAKSVNGHLHWDCEEKQKQERKKEDGSIRVGGVQRSMLYWQTGR